MSTKTDDEEIEVDTTAEKAKEIGKELGVEKEEEPDFDIVEEQDERIAKEREPKQEEKTRPTNREKRHAKIKRLTSKLDSKDEIIRQQQEQIADLARRQNDVDARLTGINKAEVDKALNDTIAKFTQAEKDHADAFAEGDGTKATKAMREMYDAQRNIEKIQTLKTQIEQRPAQQQEIAKPDAALVSKAKAWAERNAWYDPSGKDEDSEIAKALSGVLAAEGYDPKTEDFWDELDDRIKERLPGKIAEDDEEEEPAPKPKRRASPPVGGASSNRGDLNGRKTITVPTDYLNKLKANGITDPERIRKIVLDRQRIIRESGN